MKDWNCNVLGVERYLNYLQWSHQKEFYLSERKPWFVDNQLAGFVKSFDNLSTVTVLNAGHEVPPLFFFLIVF
jgi:carboxypeptidase C (cathepsin A)